MGNGLRGLEGLRQLAAANTNTYGAKKYMKSAASVAVVPAIGFFSGESFWGPLQSRSIGVLIT